MGLEQCLQVLHRGDCGGDRRLMDVGILADGNGQQVNGSCGGQLLTVPRRHETIVLDRIQRCYRALRSGLVRQYDSVRAIRVGFIGRHKKRTLTKGLEDIDAVKADYRFPVQNHRRCLSSLEQQLSSRQLEKCAERYPKWKMRHLTRNEKRK